MKVRLNCCVGLFVLLNLLLSHQVYSQAQRIVHENEHVFPSGSKAILAKDWFFDAVKNRLMSPEEDLEIHFIEAKFQKNVERVVLNYWKKLDPQFAYKVDQITELPIADGWEKIYQIFYSTPVKEKKIVLAIIRVSRGEAFLNLVQGSLGAFDRRGAQIKLTLNSWKSANFKTENLGQRKPIVWSEKQHKDFIGFFHLLMKKFKVPGASIAIVQNEKVVFQIAQGVIRQGSTDLIKSHTPFMIGSTTKPLTTLMLAKLVEQKKLSWETPIQKILPQFVLADNNLSNSILLKHTTCACTGMPRRDLEFIFEMKNLTGEKIIQQMREFSPTTKLGETFQYSNHLVALGGYAGGLLYAPHEGSYISSYEKAMKDLVLYPLGMENTFVKPTVSQIKSLPSPHAQDLEGNIVPIPQAMDDMVYSVAPAGSIWSSAIDLARYMIMEMHDGKIENGKEYISYEQLKIRRTPGVKVDDTTFYGLGFFIENDKGLEIYGHGGNTLGFTSDLFFIPKDRLGMVVLANLGDANQFRNILKLKFLEMFYDADKRSVEFIKSALTREKQKIKKAKERLKSSIQDVKWIERFAGKYSHKNLGTVELKKSSEGMVFDVGEWNSRLGSVVEENGDRLISLISAPWSGSFEIEVREKPSRQLILDNGQIKYEFDYLENDSFLKPDYNFPVQLFFIITS